ncbi:hypothetical protein T484DRAFT_1948035 [Baffinella frigidus]|nr:hypothetical protein T484DRAFT_1948035 [Cryptophyta sp. CCMP2293]
MGVFCPHQVSPRSMSEHPPMLLDVFLLGAWLLMALSRCRHVAWCVVLMSGFLSVQFLSSTAWSRLGQCLFTSRNWQRYGKRTKARWHGTSGKWTPLRPGGGAPCSRPLSAAPRLSRPTRRCPVCTANAAAPPTP